MPRTSMENHALSPRVQVRRWVIGDDVRSFGDRQGAHPGFEIAWCKEGGAEYRIGKRLVELRPGAAIIVPAGFEHVTIPRSRTLATSLMLTNDAVDAAGLEIGARIEEVRLDDGDPSCPSVLSTIGLLLEREAVSSRTGHALAVDALTDALVVEVLRKGAAESERSCEPRRSQDPRVRRAVDLLQTKYADALTIDDIARAAHMSRYHFSRLFRLETGKSPYQYLLDVRLTRAAELLATSRFSVTEAAFEVGFHDLGRFGRMFRRAHGVAPSEFRQRRASAGRRMIAAGSRSM